MCRACLCAIHFLNGGWTIWWLCVQEKPCPLADRALLRLPSDKHDHVYNMYGGFISDSLCRLGLRRVCTGDWSSGILA